jgi:hypothetical protein
MAAQVLGNPTVYHSGQVVPISDWYELVGSTGHLYPKRIRIFFQHGDVFPDHEGRAVCWCVSTMEHDYPVHDADQPPSAAPTASLYRS